ncbi:MAG TPA: hypothetical protein VFM11_09095 [Burkholderiales bacterium]|nr:hypothetical protein [Burkholderiales bacterium]
MDKVLNRQGAKGAKKSRKELLISDFSLRTLGALAPWRFNLSTIALFQP